MQKREDSCDLYFWEVADVGECNYADYLVSRGIPIPVGWGVGQVTEGTTEEEDAEQKIKVLGNVAEIQNFLRNTKINL